VNTQPYRSLERNHWFKLILGASFQHLPAVESLALIWSLAGVDCVDTCADPAVVQAVERGFSQAQQLAMDWGREWHRPWVMVSLNDGEDPHFRKAYFPSALCPPTCPRPCIPVCPVQAIDRAGVSAARCYGCGRCQPVCPLGLIEFATTQADPVQLSELLAPCGVDALEIHTHVGNGAGFTRLWTGLGDWLTGLKLISISFPDEPGLWEHLQAISQLIQQSTLPVRAKTHIIWQTDGIPMSGDQGASRAKASIYLAKKVLSWDLPGFVQLAGGTNQHSATLARAEHLAIAGIAYGSYARKLSQEFFTDLDAGMTPSQLAQAVQTAGALVAHTKEEQHNGQCSHVGG